MMTKRRQIAPMAAASPSSVGVDSSGSAADGTNVTGDGRRATPPIQQQGASNPPPSIDGSKTAIKSSFHARTAASDQNKLNRFVSRAQSQRVAELATRAAALDSPASTGQSTTARSSTGELLLHIDSPFIVVWDTILLLFIVYITFMTPLAVAMDLGDVNVENPWTALVTVDFIIDIVFIADVALNFYTSYIDRNGMEVCDSDAIKKNYLKTWFSVDFVSSIPFSVFQVVAVYLERANLSTGALTNSESIDSFLRVSRVVRILKVARLVKCIRIITKSTTLEISKNQRRLLRDLGILVVLLHFVACTYITVAFVGGGEDSLHGSWVSSYIPEVSALQGAELNLELYVSALYWAVATLTTVGFGDVVPVNTSERVVAIIAMLVSAAYYGYLIASMASGVTAWDANAARMNERLEQLGAYTKAKRFPRKLRRRIETYYRSYYKQKTTINELEVLRGLSVGLRREVQEFMLDDAKGELLSNMMIFKGLDRSVLAKLFLALTPQHFNAGDRMMESGHAERSLFILLAGQAVIDTPHFPQRPSTNLKVGAAFGELQFLGLRSTSVLTLTAKTACKVWAISRKDFFEMLDETDDTLSRIVSTAMAIYERYFEAFMDAQDLDIDSRLTKYIAEVARFDAIEEHELMEAEANGERQLLLAHASEVAQSVASAADVSRERILSEGSVESVGGVADQGGAGSGTSGTTGIPDTPPLTQRKRASFGADHTPDSRLQSRGSAAWGEAGTNNGSASDSSQSGSSTPTVDSRLDSFKKMFEARLLAMNRMLDDLGALPCVDDGKNDVLVL